MDLDEAVAQLKAWSPASHTSGSIDPALELVLQASRDITRRDLLNQQELLPLLLPIFSASTDDLELLSTEGSLNVLRCIGNLVADNGMYLYISSPQCHNSILTRHV